jgi:hypothetical protein
MTLGFTLTRATMFVGEEHAPLESRAGIGRSSDAKRRHRRRSRASRSRADSSTVLGTPRFGAREDEVMAKKKAKRKGAKKGKRKTKRKSRK